MPVEAFPDIVERLRGTPARLEDRVRGVSGDALTRRDGGRWSAQENIGHLLDLEALWNTVPRHLMVWWAGRSF